MTAPEPVPKTPLASGPPRPLRLWREPLLHFILGGALLAIVQQLLAPTEVAPESDKPRITVPAAVVAEAREYLLRAHGREPSESEVKKLVDQYVEDELLFREALELGLVGDDPALRQAVVEKMVSQALPLTPASEAELRNFLNRNQRTFERPANVSFEHVFFDAARGHRQADAKAARERIASLTATPKLGDRFSLGSEIGPRTERELGAIFGNTFARKVFELGIGEWSEPLQSPQGWHLVRLLGRQDARLPSFDEVRVNVERAFEQERRSSTRRALVADLRSKYQIRMGEQQSRAVGSANAP